MKLFIAALCCLALITAFCIFGTVASTNIIDGILDDLHSTPTNLDRIPPKADEVSERILTTWDEKFFIISILHPHQHLDEVKEKMTALQSYAQTEEYAEWAEAHANLEEALLHLRGLLEANIDNIL